MTEKELDELEFEEWLKQELIYNAYGTNLNDTDPPSELLKTWIKWGFLAGRRTLREKEK
jgi:hypothetical protein